MFRGRKEETLKKSLNTRSTTLNTVYFYVPELSSHFTYLFLKYRTFSFLERGQGVRERNNDV